MPERKSLTVCIWLRRGGGATKSLRSGIRAAVCARVPRPSIVYGGAKNGSRWRRAEAIRPVTVIGVIRLLVDKELFHKGLNEIHVAVLMHERKKKCRIFGEAFRRFREELNI